MKKRLISIITATSVILSTSGGAVVSADKANKSDIDTEFDFEETASYDAVSENDKSVELLELTEEVSGTCGENLTWVLTTDGKLTISGTGDMYDWDYDSNKVPWNDYRGSITDVVIDDGVTSIGDYAFFRSYYLTSVEIPNSVTSIGYYAFNCCNVLTSITIPNSVTSIGTDVFGNCPQLKEINIDSSNANYASVDGVLFDKDIKTIIKYPKGKTDTEYTIPNSVTSIGNSAFSGCDGLTKIEIPNSVTSIGESAFSSCSGLTRIEIPNSVTSIGNVAFVSCSGLTRIEIPNSVTFIGRRAFWNCTGLTKIEIPNSVTKISTNTFDGCTNLTSVIIPESVTSISNDTFSRCSDSLVIYGSANSTAQTYAKDNDITFVEIAEVVNGTCGENLTWSFNNVGTLTISGTGEMDGYDAYKTPWNSFSDMITSLVVESGVTSIGKNAFIHCEKIADMKIADTVKSIYDNAFQSCYALTDVEFPDGVEHIGKTVFLGCKNLNKVTIPKTVTSMGSGAVNDCAYIAVDKNNQNFKSVDGVLYSKDGKLLIGYPSKMTNETYTLQSGVETISKNAFIYSQLTSIELPVSVVSISQQAFYGSDKLAEVKILSPVAKIGDSAFGKCTSLTIKGYADSTAETYANENSITFEEIDAKASGTCGDNLTWNLYDNGLLTISGTGDMTNYDNKENLPPWASYKDDITAVVISEGVTSVGYYAFINYFNLEYVHLPDSLETIGKFAFQGTNIDEITIPKNVSGIRQGAVNIENAINVDIENENFKSVDGVLFSKNGEDLVQYPRSKVCENYIVPDGTKNIGEYAFYGASAVNNVVLPASVESIGSIGFRNCRNLESVKILNKNAGIAGDSFTQTASDFVIRSYANSLVQMYANNNGINFEELVDVKIDGTVENSTVKFKVSYSGLPSDAYAVQFMIPMDEEIFDVDSIEAEELSEDANWAYRNDGYFVFAAINAKCKAVATAGSGDLVEVSVDLKDKSKLPVSLNFDESQTKFVIVDGKTISSNALVQTGVTFDKSISVYDITYDYATNGGTSATSESARVYENNEVDLTPTAEKSDWEFVGWNTDKDATTALTSYTPTADTTLYAIYKKSLTANFYSGANNLQETKTVTLYNNSTSGEVAVPEVGAYSGWTALGWRDDTTAGASEYAVNKSIAISENANFYAAYSRTLTLSYNANDGSSTPQSQTATQYYNASGEKESKTFTLASAISRDGYTFNNWAAGSVSGTAYKANSSITVTDNTVMYAVWTAMSTTATPVITVSDIVGGKTVKMSCATSGATIYYTTDGSTPTTSSTKYTSAINIKSVGNLKIKAVAIASGYINSSVASADVSVEKVSSPKASVDSGNINKAVNVAFSTETSGATIYYTTDGSTPTTGSNKYTGAITVDKTMTVKAVAVLNGYVSSDVVTYDYVLKNNTSGTEGSILWNFADGELVIDGSGAISDHETGNAQWYHLKDEIKKVTIKDGINTIGQSAFENLSKVTAVTIPSSVLNINKNAFAGCSALKSIALPDAMTGGIGEGAFKDCTSLTNITVPSNVSSIGAGAFEGCTSVSEIILPFVGSQNGKLNNEDTFDYIFNADVPTKLKKVTITNESNVPENAFAGLANIKNVTLNDGVLRIGGGAFDGCSSLASFEIPSGVKEIGDNTFRGCESAVSIVVPDSIKSIGEGAFDGCKKLSSVNIPNNGKIEYIYSNTFRNCSSLKVIEIPTSVTSIGENVLTGCTSLIDVTVPFVGANANPGSKEVTPEGIFGYFFGGDNSSVPASVTKVEVNLRNEDSGNKGGYIPKEAFKNCANIKDILVNGGTSVLDNAFANCRNLRNVYIPKRVATIGKTILADCDKLETLTVPFIGNGGKTKPEDTSVLGGFFGYDDDDITYTQQYYDDNNYHYYKIPSTLKNVSVLNQVTIPYGAFMNCYGLESVTLVKGNDLNDYAFYNCQDLVSVTLPNDMNNIYTYAFANCEKLETINVPNKVKNLGESIFYGCKNLKNVTIPNSVTDIAEDLFNGTNVYALDDTDSVEDIDLFASELVFICSEGSEAYAYAQRKGIATNVVPESELDIRKTATTVSKLSDGSYLFDVINSRDMSGILHIELYDNNSNLVSEETMSTGDEVEYRVKVSEEVMAKVAFANVYISDENGERVSTEDEVITYSEKFTPVKSDIKISYNKGIVSFSGTTEIKSGAKLLEVIYNSDGSMYKVNTYDVSNVEDEITVSGEVSDGSIKFMLLENMQSLRPMAEILGR